MCNNVVLLSVMFLQVCKHFLDAIENSKYGWFWVCPGGGDNCMYRHALPPGFVLKKDKKKEEKAEEISLEELIENEVKILEVLNMSTLHYVVSNQKDCFIFWQRAALGHNVTRITLETFLAWKKRKKQEKVSTSLLDVRSSDKLILLRYLHNLKYFKRWTRQERIWRRRRLILRLENH